MLVTVDKVFSIKSCFFFFFYSVIKQKRVSLTMQVKWTSIVLTKDLSVGLKHQLRRILTFLKPQNILYQRYVPLDSLFLFKKSSGHNKNPVLYPDASLSLSLWENGCVREKRKRKKACLLSPFVGPLCFTCHQSLMVDTFLHLLPKCESKHLRRRLVEA